MWATGESRIGWDDGADMPDAEIDLVSETLGEGPGDRREAPRFDDALARDSRPTAPGAATNDSPAAGVRWLADPAHTAPLPAIRALRPSRAVPVRRARQGAAVALAFAAGAAGVLILFVATAMAIAAVNADRVLPGVHVGAVDVSGLTRQEAVAKLRNAYSYLSQGDIEITTPSGSASVGFGSIGRAPDAEAMADAALKAGRTGYPLSDAVTTWRSVVEGQDISIAIRIDPEAVSARVRELTLTSVLPPRDAEATLFYGTFVYWPSARGSAVDEDAVGQAIITNLTRPDAPSHFQAGGALMVLQPAIDDADAQNAIAVAERMSVDVTLTLDPAAGPSPTASASGTPIPAKTYVIPADTVRSWIVFGVDEQGNYGPSLDMSLVEAYVASLPGTILVAPTEPRVIFDSTGTPVSLEGGQDGLGIHTTETAEAVEAYLMRLAGGGAQEPSVALAVGPISPQITVGDLSDLTILGGGDGQYTVYFYPGETNGDGLNIRTPAAVLNGQIVPPGAQFGFLKAVGPIDEAHGYTWGGVILHGKSDHTGAIGGGICSASTTMFNAALRAGLQIDERTAHAYYIDRYPAGLDATVYAAGGHATDLKWTNDTPYPIVIRAWATNKSKSQITIQLWSRPLDRTVVLDYPIKKENIVKAGDSTVYVSTLAPGEKYRAEYPTDGFDIVRTRTVFDEDGTLIHSDTWKSHYVRVDGILQIGASPSPTPTPTPTPTAVFALPVLTLFRRAARRAAARL
jgi:vancomycin resistance protein YoaR